MTYRYPHTKTELSSCSRYQVAWKDLNHLLSCFSHYISTQREIFGLISTVTGSGCLGEEQSYLGLMGRWLLEQGIWHLLRSSAQVCFGQIDCWCSLNNTCMCDAEKQNMLWILPSELNSETACFLKHSLLTKSAFSHRMLCVLIIQQNC